MKNSICIKYFFVNLSAPFVLNKYIRIEIGEKIKYYKYTFQNGIKYALHDTNNKEYVLMSEYEFKEYFMDESEFRTTQIDKVLNI